MSHVKRFFIAKGVSPLFTELTRIVAVRRKNLAAIKKFLKKHKIDNMYGHTPEDYKFGLVKGYDEKVWAKTKAVRGVYFIKPRRNTAEGKAMAAEISALPPFPDVADAISIVPGLGRFPMVFAESRCYFPFVRYYNLKNKTVIIEVPSVEATPAELAKYAKQKSSSNSNMAAALWQPPDYLKEIKEWEALKEIDEA